ncbi:MAG: hypothetical protein AB8G22_22785, partial [Saprospiraceae bacterium]
MNFIIPFLLLTFLPLVSYSQSCGCSNCPLPIQANQSDYELCYDVFNVSNNDLSDSGQGVCQVDIRFAHSSVKNLEINLRSPSNQLTQLIGDYTPVGLTTNIGTS